MNEVGNLVSDKEVWIALLKGERKGKHPDQPFLNWLTTQPCAKCGRIGIPEVFDVVYHHLKWVSEGSGTGIKPPFCAIPLCVDPCHDIAHQKGNSAIADRKTLETWRYYYPTLWALEKLSKILGSGVMDKDQVDIWIRHNVKTID